MPLKESISYGEAMIGDSVRSESIKLEASSLQRRGLDALVRALERTREIIATEPIASTVERELLPGPGSDIEACIRNTAITTHHPACSVAMGSQPDSPLDEKLRVRGVDNLRVADASALPQIPRANTNAPSIMVGERCADFLLAQSASVLRQKFIT
jgi:choline dehydrogenase